MGFTIKFNDVRNCSFLPALIDSFTLNLQINGRLLYVYTDICTISLYRHIKTIIYNFAHQNS